MARVPFRCAASSGGSGSRPPSGNGGWKQQQIRPRAASKPSPYRNQYQNAQNAQSAGGPGGRGGGSYGGGSARKPSGASQQLVGDFQQRGAGNRRQQGGGRPVAVPVRDMLLEAGINLSQYGPGTQRTSCPKCLGGTDKEKSLSVTIKEDGEFVYHCFRGSCGFRGGSGNFAGSSSSPKSKQGGLPDQNLVPLRGSKKDSYAVPRPKFLPVLPPQVLHFFTKRGISKETLDRSKVQAEWTMCPQKGHNALAVAFPYYENGELVNIKYRLADEKVFWQVKGAKKVLFGLDDIVNESTIIIVEGECDKLALQQAGFSNCVSVPDGAPSKVSENGVPASAEEDKKFSYIWNCRTQLDYASRILIGTDSDEPGQALGEELARRLGKERCWSLKWPEGCKDANDTLQRHGVAGMQAVLDAPEAFPIRGLFDFKMFQDDILSYYGLKDADERRGVSTGWSNVDECYRVVPGELTIVTGVPNSGKSEWIDALLYNIATNSGWCFALCSMEKKVREHGRQLLEKHVGKPFFDAPYARGEKRMSQEEVEAGLEWLSERFFLIRHEDEMLPNIDWILDIGKAAVMRYGIRGLVIDPYNELDHQRPDSRSETEYVSQMLTKIKRFAQHYDCHVWFVAHPKQLQNWKGEAPDLYDISGSAHFINKADNGLVIHRSRDTSDPASMRAAQIFVRKVRNKAAGHIGDCTLYYDRRSGRYVMEDPGED
ncbi:Twinkle-like protein [Chloropicon primus]|uniref:Twinkle-like protein n=2 Tax=Chloropicon primus TaxID=1764295 RepID=A0A5B8MBM6_9CHLO|nr:Twinkle-like protein [Chloropicon primus]UPQ96970.1 Twinkle-like protein [Chloropicon primus]|eukprot:QDZ17753.1 Twinkle-like protein [Chloropicon primus]